MKIKDEEIIYKRCDEKSIDEICHIQDVAFEHLEDKSLLRRNSKEMLLDCLRDPHYTLGAYYKEKLIAFAVLFDAGETQENIGLDLEMTKEELNESINMKLIIVLPEYRGNGLQNKLMLMLEKEAVKRGKKYICATVSPDNSYSSNNFIKSGYEFKITKTKYGGLKRNIYCKTL